MRKYKVFITAVVETDSSTEAIDRVIDYLLPDENDIGDIVYSVDDVEELPTNNK